MSMPRYVLVMLPVLWGLVACKHETSPFCPQGTSPLVARSAAGKSLWCESPDKTRSQWLEWHAGGKQLRQSCGYRGGKPEGSFTAWHPNGKPWVQGQFRDGLKFSKWKQWDALGSLVAEGDYASGRLVAGAPVAGMADCEKVAKP